MQASLTATSASAAQEHNMRHRINNGQRSNSADSGAAADEEEAIFVEGAAAVAAVVPVASPEEEASAAAAAEAFYNQDHFRLAPSVPRGAAARANNLNEVSHYFYTFKQLTSFQQFFFVYMHTIFFFFVLKHFC
jgi:hypothetical protein